MFAECILRYTIFSRDSVITDELSQFLTVYSTHLSSKTRHQVSHTISNV